ncbi:hypothetical protein SDC9_177674 [bioreactor metagenome]|uniref:Uncharacterized protein n=1 Tax=bioreactor metagenome TaxID=1076179 RepID=A0A645GTP0_9ZZZZ
MLRVTPQEKDDLIRLFPLKFVNRSNIGVNPLFQMFMLLGQSGVTMVLSVFVEFFSYAADNLIKRRNNVQVGKVCPLKCQLHQFTGLCALCRNVVVFMPNLVASYVDPL